MAVKKVNNNSKSNKSNKPKPKTKSKSVKKNEAKKLATKKITAKKPAKKKNYYFDNPKVESLLEKYVEDGCTDVKLRDEIMSHASELIRQIIRAHNFEHIFPGRDQSSFGELFQTAWVQIERVLYKYNPAPGSPKVFNLWCIKPDTNIFTEDGIKTIGSAIADNNKMTYGLDGVTHIDDSITKSKRDVLKISVKNNYDITCTPEHYLYRLGHGGPEWIKACDLHHDDLVGIQYNQQLFRGCDNIEFDSNYWSAPDKFTEELSYIIGLYVAEGSINKNTVAIYNIDREVIDALLNNSLDLSCKHYEYNQMVYINSKGFVEFLNWLGIAGKKCYEKSIPTQILKSSREIIISFLKGLFDGDGHSSKHNGNVGFTTTSAFLCKQVRLLLLNFGIVSKMHIDSRSEREFEIKNKYKSNLRNAYQILLSSLDSLKYYETIGFSIVRKQLNVKNLRNIRVLRHGLAPKVDNLCEKHKIPNRKSGLRSTRRSSTGLCDINIIAQKVATLDVPEDDEDWLYLLERINEYVKNTDNIIWLPVVGIEESESEVCEIQVSSEHSAYIADGFISHNSQVAKTRILAYLKKEKRDKKNMPSYKDFIIRQQKTKSKSIEDFKIWLEEAKEVCMYDQRYLKIIDAIEHIWENDDKPHDGIKTKLKEMSGQDTNTISMFMKYIRLNRDEFTVNLVEARDFRDHTEDNDNYYYNEHE